MEDFKKKEFEQLKAKSLLFLNSILDSGKAPLELVNAVKTPMSKDNIVSQMARSIQTQGGSEENALAHIVEYLREN